MQELDLNTIDIKAGNAIEYLSRYLEELASYDFERFIYLLYRIDIEESRLRNLISEEENIYPTLARWIIDRQRKKQENKYLFTYPHLTDDEGRW